MKHCTFLQKSLHKSQAGVAQTNNKLCCSSIGRAAAISKLLRFQRLLLGQQPGISPLPGSMGMSLLGKQGLTERFYQELLAEQTNFIHQLTVKYIIELMFSNILKTKKLWKNYIKILKISYTSFLHSTLSIFLIFYLKQILNLGLEKRRRTVSLWKTWEESL